MVNYPKSLILQDNMAGWTGIEPATSGLTGQRSNQAELPPHERQLKVNSCQRKTNKNSQLNLCVRTTMAGGTGIEPATSGL